jgi:RNA polymerase sigma factor (sigma-70 family)
VKKPHFIETRSSVLGRAKNPSDQDGWQTFFDVYSDLIRGQAAKAGLTEDEVQDVVQETLIEISHRIQSFTYDRKKGSFKAWLFQLTRWRIANQFSKRRHGHVQIDFLDSDDESLPTYGQSSMLAGETDASWEEEWRQTLLEAALKKLRNELPPRQFQVLDLLAVKQWSVSRVAATLKMNPAGIYLLKFRAMSALKREIERLEKQRI